VYMQDRDGLDNIMLYNGELYPIRNNKIALKVNTKLGGVNKALMENEFLDSLFGSEERVILFGTYHVDISIDFEAADNYMQSQHSVVKSCGSTLAIMAASMERPIPSKYYARMRHLPQNPPKVRIADSLSAMAKELLEAHIQENEGKKATKAIFFREGVFQSLVDTK
jgi:hypothetical protein